MKKAALYIRVSTLYQIDKDSLPLQREELINYAKYVFNITEYQVFEDAGYSGKNTDRPAYQDMMYRVRNGEFSHIMVWKIDRISRNLLDFASMYDEMKDLNIAFISKNEQFDTSTAMGEAMLKIILVFAELERNMTSERVSAVMISRAEKGMWNGANVPIGYKWSTEKKYPIINDEEAVIVHEIYNLYDELHSSLQTARSLNSHGIKTKRGGYWSSATVCQILKNPFYKGTLRYNYRKAGRGKIKNENEWIIVENNHLPLIEPVQWERVNLLLKDNYHQMSVPGQMQRHKHTHVFAGVIRCKCGASGGSMLDRARQSGWRPSRYLCTRISRGRQCDNPKMVSDVLLGPFIFNYIRNIIQVQKNITDYPSATSLEKPLLQGKIFKNVFGINKQTLQELYDSFTLATSVEYPLVDEKGNTTPKSKIDTLLAERNKHQKAFDRLKNLYLYDDTAFSEKDFISEKQRIMNKIDNINAALQQLSSEATDTVSDITFLKEASNYVIAQKLLSDQELDNWQEFAENIDVDILQKFVRAVIEKITYYNENVLSIEFKNGITHTFLYR